MTDKDEIKKVLDMLDENQTPEEVRQVLENGVMIKYGEFVMIVEQSAVDNCTKYMDNKDHDEKLFLKEQAKRALDHNITLLARGTLDDVTHKRVSDDTYADMVIFHVLRNIDVQ